MKAQKSETTKQGGKKSSNKASLQAKHSLLDKVAVFFERHEKKMFYVIMAAGALMSILLFDVKVSLSGDDCDYIVAAGEFWKHFTYPGHHGPLYPIILSPFVGIFGVRIIMLKLLSTVFLVASLWFFYKGFQRITPAIITIPALFLVSINPYVFFFASYTFSEPLFMFMQSLCFYFFSKYFWRNNTVYTLGKDWKKYLIVVLTMIGMGLTRTVGFCMIGVVMLYFIIERRWKDLIYTLVIFTLLFGILYVSKPIIWPNSSTVQSFETLFAKNPYNPEQGTEDMAGLFKRAVENSHSYLSGYLYKYLGFRSMSDMPMQGFPVLSLLAYVLFFVCMASLFKANRPLLFTGMYAGTMLIANFILLHIVWAQDRILMVYYPSILLFLCGGLYYLLTSHRFKSFSWVYLLLLASVLTGTCIHAKNRIGRNIPVLQQNLLGNDLYGLTPDWENFIKMSRWANDNLDKNAVIVSRKPSISYVYTGREFLGLFNVPFININEVAEKYKAEKDDNLFLTVELGQSQPSLTMLGPFIQYVFTSKQAGIYNINNQKIMAAFVYKINKSLVSPEIIELLDANNYNYTLDYDSFLNQFIKDKTINYQVVDPDVLLEVIKENHIRYLILGKIRLYTPQNTGRFINTIHQYISLIQYKYPNQFNLIHTIGKDESCELAEFTGK